MQWYSADLELRNRSVCKTLFCVRSSIPLYQLCYSEFYCEERKEARVVYIPRIFKLIFPLVCIEE